MSKCMRLVIDRCNWAYNDDKLSSSNCLLLPLEDRYKRGKKCCLGFLSEKLMCELGQTPYETYLALVDKSVPQDVFSRTFLKKRFGLNSWNLDEFFEGAMAINDDLSDRSVKEPKLIELFAKYGIQLEFR